ncbi:helix-turn-helix domain-containing protein [Cohnella sp. GbtcB17]|uniref:helix-turn-helix domain-containing protein n=1 Tax=Cohnella sp. GbtcB17 TaxID=2824762 RepID=UPI0020C6A5FF|nr:helix-turn-helix domain-containing protein [Cohnella sp. GbtcB17]
MTVKEVAHYLRRCTKTILTRLESRDLRGYKEGRKWRIRREWLLEYEQRLINRTESERAAQ